MARIHPAEEFPRRVQIPFKFPFHLSPDQTNQQTLALSGADPAACYFERGSHCSQHAPVIHALEMATIRPDSTTIDVADPTAIMMSSPRYTRS